MKEKHTTNSTWISDDLDRRIRAARLADPDVSQQLAADFLVQATTRVRPSKFKSWSILAIISCIAGGVIAVPVAAVAMRTFDAQTGIFNPVETAVNPQETAVKAGEDDPVALNTEATPGAEWIDMGSSDIEQYMASVAPLDLPLPAGVTWDAVITRHLDAFSAEEYAANNDLGQDGGGIAAESIVIDLRWEREARYAWMLDWFEAYDMKDAARMKAAGLALAASVDWPAEVKSTGGFAAEEIRQWMLLIGEGNYEAAQAFAHFSIWHDLWDGEERYDLSDSLLSGRYWSTMEGAQ